MSLIDNNPLLRGVSGMLGDTFVIRKVRGMLQMANKPARKKKASEKQLEIKLKFKEAVQYADEALANATTRKLYEAGITPKKHSAHVVAVTDYLKAPNVHDVDAIDYLGNVGDTILVKATDDFEVTGVKIAISDSDGKVLEKGDASPDERINFWKYTATVANPSVVGSKIQATAFDRPGNKGTAEKVL